MKMRHFDTVATLMERRKALEAVAKQDKMCISDAMVAHDFHTDRPIKLRHINLGDKSFIEAVRAAARGHIAMIDAELKKLGVE